MLLGTIEPQTRRSARVPAAVLVVMLAVVAMACAKPPDSGAPNNGPNDPPGTAPDGTPLFPVPKDTGDAVHLAGLRLFPAEKFNFHHHAHIDVIINGHPVVIPAQIGIDPKDGFSPLHTHDTTGVIHIESEKDDVFRVGQLFAEWGVKLDKNCIATYCNDENNQLLGFVDGQMAGDSASIPFAEHEVIVVWYGPRGANPPIPTTADFSSV